MLEIKKNITLCKYTKIMYFKMKFDKISFKVLENWKILKNTLNLGSSRKAID